MMDVLLNGGEAARKPRFQYAAEDRLPNCHICFNT
jgi:hypothetical protein